MLVDTDVLIWYLRGYAQAAAALDQLPNFSISSVTHMEIVQGMRNKAELAAFKKMLVQRAAQHLPVTQAISKKSRRPDGIHEPEPWVTNGRCTHSGHGARASTDTAHRKHQALFTNTATGN